jgi:DNA-binding CsgD family transcriptional regulator
LLSAICSALERNSLQKQLAQHLAELRDRLSRLTARERQVMTLLLAGLRNKQAAGQLGIQEVTLQVHRGQVMRKMRARSFAELGAMGQALGLTPTFMHRQPSVLPSSPGSAAAGLDKPGNVCQPRAGGIQGRGVKPYGRRSFPDRGPFPLRETRGL